MTHLYELSTELATINDELITAEGEITPELESRLDAVNLALTEKATGLRKWLARIDGDSAALSAEIKRLQTIKKQQENLQWRLMEYIKHNMIVADLKTISTQIGTFSICKNPTSVEIILPDSVPKDFQDEVPAHWEINKKKVKDVLEQGHNVPWAKLVTDKVHLRVK